MHHAAPRSPSPAAAGFPLLGRRDVLRGLLLAGGALALPGLAACGSGGSGGDPNTVTFGSNYSDEVPRQAIAATMQAFEQRTGLKVAINTKDHNTYQEQINNYLQGRPDDVFAWFAGYRMRHFAARGLATDISDVWQQVGGDFSQSLREASTGLDGRQYLIPFYYYPWAVFYRRSVWKQRGYTPPRTLDEFVALAERMRADGLIPIAFGQKDGWPAMGTFDYLDLRINGYEFHMNLLAGREDWQGPQVRQVFDTWRRLLPLHQENALGRTWQEAAQTLQQGRAGMYLLGTFVAEQFTDDRDDLDFFPFPEINPEHGRDTVEAPIDGFMLSRRPANPDGARRLLTFLAGPEAQLAYLRSNPTNIAATSKAGTSGYNALQRKSVELIQSAAHVTQFLDRDTNPTFASDAMTNGINAFLRNPDDVDSVLRGLADQAKSIFVE
ncbi:MAG TPA: ABC transporter substrate-binding protein [Pseudonocardiaceae bacterium]